MVKAFVRLLNEIIKSVKWEGEKVVYYVGERDVIIVCIVEDIEKKLEFRNVVGFVFTRDLTYIRIRSMSVGTCEEEIE